MNKNKIQINLFVANLLFNSAFLNLKNASLKVQYSYLGLLFLSQTHKCFIFIFSMYKCRKMYTKNEFVSYLGSTFSCNSSD